MDFDERSQKLIMTQLDAIKKFASAIFSMPGQRFTECETFGTEIKEWQSRRVGMLMAKQIADED